MDKSANKWQILKDAPFLQGGLNRPRALQDKGTITIEGGMNCDHLNDESPEFVVQMLQGNIPHSIVLESFNHPDNMSIAHNIRLGGGTLYLHTAPAGVEQNITRKVYYDDLRPYRQEACLEIGYLKSGDYELNNVLLDATIQNGAINANHFSTELLGGDILGNLTLRLNSKREFNAHLMVQASNIDASNFVKLDLQPGPDSELSADMRLSLYAAPAQRDINLDVNVTQIGKKTLDRFLQLLDPNKRTPKFKDSRQPAADQHSSGHRLDTARESQHGSITQPA